MSGLVYICLVYTKLLLVSSVRSERHYFSCKYQDKSREFKKMKYYNVLFSFLHL